jgi:hypothetical protein
MDAVDEIDPIPETAASDVAEMTGTGWSRDALATFVAALAVMMAALKLSAVAVVSGTIGMPWTV